MSPPARVAGALAGVLAVAGYRAVFGSRSQLFGAFPYSGATSARVVALTFDDGPNEPYTSRLLDILAERNVTATFFAVGRCAERFPEVTRRLVAEGHVLGNHSYDHAFSTYGTEPRQRDQIRRGADTLHAITGMAPALYRPPWLCHPSWVLRSAADAGLQVVSGTFASPVEIVQPPARWMTADGLRRARPGGILILHDGREARGGDRGQTVAAVGPLIDGLRDRGYTFATVDQLLGVAPYHP